MLDHIGIKAETTFGTFVTPTAFVPTISVSAQAGVSKMEQRETGRSSGLADADLGAILPSGSITIRALPEHIGILLKAMLNKVTSSQIAATTAYTHVFEPDDTAALNSISIQLQHKGGGTTTATNIRGARVASMKLSVSQGGYAELSFDYLAVEQLTAGGTFADSTSSPAAATPSYSADIEAFDFADATLVHAGTAAQNGTTGIWTITSGTTLSNVESFEVSISWNLEQRTFLNSRYAGKIIAANFGVNWSFTMDNDIPSTVFHDKLIAGTKEPIDFKLITTSTIESGHVYEFQITVPNADYREAPFGDLSGDTGARSISVSGVGVNDASEDVPIGVYLKDSNTSY